MHGSTADAPRQQKLPMGSRVVSHVTVWVAVLVPTIVVLSRGWIATGDDATIAIRAYQSLSLHPPLTGMLTTAGTMAHRLYDPGPLLFWLLAVPTHLDPVRGALWGAAVLGGVALSVAVEAVWSSRMWIGCAVIAFVALDLLWRTPAVFSNLTWNAYFPIPFFIATLALAWVVATGGLGWWPALIVVGSVAAQSHLLFVLPAVALALLAPLVALMSRGRPERFRWLSVGGALAVVCWAAPLLQNLGAHGNLTALANAGRGMGGSEQTLGITLGLKLVATAGSVWPIWLRAGPPSTNYFDVLGIINHNSAVYALFLLALLVLVTVVAWTRGQRALSALGFVALVSSVSLMVSYARFPRKNALSVDYLIVALWAVGVLLWVVVGWAAGLVAVAIAHRYSRARGQPARSERQWRRWEGVFGTVMMVAAVVVGVAGLWSLRQPHGYDPNSAADQMRARAVDQISQAIEQLDHRGPVVFSVGSPGGRGADSLNSLMITEGVGWRLDADGWRPGLYGLAAAYTGLVLSPRPASVRVTLAGARVASITPVRLTRGMEMPARAAAAYPSRRPGPGRALTGRRR